jgi:LacI family transcriptional regulator
VDNVLIARLAIAHLAELGHRRIAYVGGALLTSSSRDRWNGFGQTCRELSLECIQGKLTAAPAHTSNILKTFLRYPLPMLTA